MNFCNFVGIFNDYTFTQKKAKPRSAYCITQNMFCFGICLFFVWFQMSQFLTCSCKNLTIVFLDCGRFLTAIPRVLAEIYHSLGTQLPEVLLAVLPPDFFSDDSVAKDSISPSASSLPLSAQCLVSDDKDGLQDLRNRSGNKKRWGGRLKDSSIIDNLGGL